MRVLITCPDLNGPGGVAHYYRAILPRLDGVAESLEIGTNYSSGWNLPGPVRLVLDVFSFIKRVGRYDLIHLNPSLCARCFFREVILLFIAKMTGRKVVVFFRGWEKAFEQKVDRRWKWLFRLGYCRADTIVVLAAEFEDAIRRWGYTGRIVQETTTVDERMLKKESFSKCVPDERLNVLFLARVEKDKGVYEAVDAVARLADPDVIFCVGGDGGERLHLAQYIKDRNYGGIQVAGYIKGEKKIEAYRNADVFLFPSYYGEGMPNSVLEAMAFGLPVITCPTGGIKDFFEDGKMGVLVPPRDTKGIINALKRLKADPALWLNISEYNAEYARENFYSERVAMRLLRIYNEAINGEGTQ